MIKRGQLLFILILTFVMVVAWIGFNLYHTWVTSTISPDLQLAISPITPDFDSAVLERLKSRENVIPVFSLQASPSVSPTPSPALATPSASVSAGQ